MKKNILLVDDSALMRRVISDIINSDNRFQVTETAANCLEALNIILDRGEKLDAVILDINMPKMNGIEFLEQLNIRNIKITVIIVSTIARRDAKETIRALELGAFDFVTKPENYIEVKSNIFTNKVLECLSLAMKLDQDQEKKNLKIDIERLARKRKRENPDQACRKLVAIACSTGGPKALHEVIPKLPENLDASVLIVQHMPGGFTKSLADRLNDLSKVEVKEAQDGDEIKKGVVYIAKGGYQMRLKNGDGKQTLAVTSEAARRGLSPCADIMYESLVDSEYDQIFCVVLTGMGGDGLDGITLLNKSKNIYVIAQDEETSIVYGMPKVIRDAGLADEIVALDQVAEAIIKNVGVYEYGC